MNVKFMMGVLTYVSVALVHECQAGSTFSTPKSNTSLEVKDERRTVPPRQNSNNSQRIHPPVSSSQNLNIAPKMTPVISTEDDSSKKALVVIKTFEFHGHQIPYLQSADLSFDKTKGITIKQPICTITLLTIEQQEKHDVVQKMLENSDVPESIEDLNNVYLPTIYDDLKEIGELTRDETRADEAIQTLKALVQHLNLSDIYSRTKFLRQEKTLESRMMVTMKKKDEGVMEKKDEGEVIILNIHPLPEHLWKQ